MKRQLDDLRTLAHTRGWQILAEYSDNDISAYNGDERPQYELMMKAVAEGGIQVVVAYQPSRLWRRRVERAMAIDVLHRVGGAVAFVTGGFFDCRNATERSQLAQVGESDTLESEVKAERVARTALERAQEGRANGAVSYGWQRVYEYDHRGRVTGFRDVEEPAQAAIVREVTERFLEADTLIGITDDLNKRGVQPPGAHLEMKKKKRAPGNLDGTRWSKTSVKKLLLRPANAGYRVHHGDLYPAAFPALVEEVKWRRVVAILTAPERSVKCDGTRKHLLSWGIGECGVCGDRLRVARRGHATYGTKQPLYVCDATKSCVGRRQSSVDDWVGSVVVERLSRPDALEVFLGDDDGAVRLREQAAALKARLDAAADEYADGILTPDQLRRITVKLKSQIVAVEQEARQLSPQIDAEALAGVVGERAEEAWASLGVLQRRAVLEALGVRVVVLPVQRRGPGFDPATVRVVWPSEAV